MTRKTLAILACSALTLVGCSRIGDSGLNPLGWLGGSSQPTTLEPEGGYPTANQDERQLVAHVSGAQWQPMYEGRMLVVTGLANTKGWWNLALVTEEPMPRGRTRPDQNGVLRLRLLGNPPLPNSFEAANAASPASDTFTVSMVLSNNAMINLREVVITGAGNSVTLRK